MRIFFLAFMIFIIGQVYAEEPVKIQVQKKEDSESNIVLYKDRCVATLPVKFGQEKNYVIAVPGSLDPQSILFQQENGASPEYGFSNNKEASIAELILNSWYQGLITYTFSGINWHMHYVVEINEQFDEIQKFAGFIDIDNQSGASFEKVYLRLVDAQTDELAKNQTFREYVVDVPKNLYKGRVVRIPWITLNKQKAEQDYRLDVGRENLKDLQGKEKQIPLQIWLHFKLDEKLGKDLASGDITVYLRDSSKILRFLGSSSLQNVRVGEEIQLAVPPLLLAQFKSSQDSPLLQIQGNLEQTEFKTLLTEKVTEAAYRLTIRNFGEKEANIKVMLYFGENRGKVIRESMAHKQENSQSVYWPVKVAPKTEIVLRYRVQLVKE
ncbi:MAG: hypothetical protein ACK4V2_06295 [Pseudomonadota bacterium]|jgi:hypothetical protein|nr:hypothetical protein [Alphaproteobacteria bacterium]